MKTLLFISLAVVTGAQIVSAQGASDYYPLHVGDYWVQHTDTIFGEYQPTTFRKDIEAIDLILGEEYLRMRQQLIEDDGSHYHSPWYTWLRIDSSGVLMGAFGDTSIVDSSTIYDPPILWLPNEIVNLGYSWESDAPEFGWNYSFTVESISESVQVPAGTFDDCIKIKLIGTNTSGDTTQWNHFYYAEDVGEVLNIGWSEWSEYM